MCPKKLVSDGDPDRSNFNGDDIRFSHSAAIDVSIFLLTSCQAAMQPDAKVLCVKTLPAFHFNYTYSITTHYF